MTRLNLLFFAILNYFSDFATFINVLSKTFLSLSSFLLVLLKNIFFEGLLACQLVFNSLKKMVTKALIPANYKQSIKTIIMMDISDYVSSKIFFQLSNNILLYFIAFFSKNLNLVEYNYKIYDKNLPAIIKCFK